MRILILDDDINRHRLFKMNFIGHELSLVTTVHETIYHLTKNKFDAIFLDHDLGGHAYVESGGSEPTGYDVAKWLSENPQFKPGQIYIHSLNPVGAQNIKNILPDSIMAPGLWLISNENF